MALFGGGRLVGAVVGTIGQSEIDGCILDSQNCGLWSCKESDLESWRTQTILVVLVSICIDFMDMVNDDVESNLEYHEH